MRKLPWNWRDRLVFEDVEDKWTYGIVIKFAKGKTPRGLSSYIGEISVDKKKPHLIDFVDIVPRLQRRGLGMNLYQMMLLRHGQISTIYHDASPAAQKVWKKLVQIYPYELDFWTKTITIKAQ